MAYNDILLRLLEGKKVERTPVWLMRQAGRYLEEYGLFRKNRNFLDLCRDADAICNITMQPVDILGVDAAILFSDILIFLPSMGLNLEYNPSPVVKYIIESEKDVLTLKEIHPESDLNFILESIVNLTEKLSVPLIGFAGGPFTIASYILEDSQAKDFLKTKSFMYNKRHVFTLLMELLSTNIKRFLKAQIESGCKIVQIFDTWAGILSFDDYNDFVFPFIKDIFASLDNAYKIYFIKNGSAYYEKLRELNIDVLSVDWRQPLSTVSNLSENRFIMQGNLDPATLLAEKELLSKKIDNILGDAKHLRGHIFNLGHGIYPQSKRENVKFLVDYVKEKSMY